MPSCAVEPNRQMRSQARWLRSLRSLLESALMAISHAAASAGYFFPFALLVAFACRGCNVLCTMMSYGRKKTASEYKSRLAHASEGNLKQEERPYV